MDMIILMYILTFVAFITGTVCQDLSISLSMQPSHNGGKVVQGSTVLFRCTVDMNILGHSTVEWYQRQGVNRYQLGTNSFKSSHLKASRYHLKRESHIASTAVYTLTITDVQIEDSATYECAAGKPSTRKASQVLAVCDDINLEVCDCALSSGWTSPDCIYTADSDNGFDRATIGLAVCLAITVLYATLASAVVVYDCRHKLRESRLKEEEREAALARNTAVISSQTAASSAMKPRSASSSTTVNERQTVRFTDSSASKTDITC